MKYLFLTITCLFLYFQTPAQGVRFDSLTLSEALQQAKATKKLVFVDCFTTWCSPCIYMTREVFPLKEAGEFFNKHFINVMFDMEQEQGREINRTYSVASYPTYLILAPDGKEQYRLVGRDELPRFIVRASRGLDPKNALPVLESEYAAGKMKPARIINYLSALGDAYRFPRQQEVFNERVCHMTLQEITDDSFWSLWSDPRVNPYSIKNAHFVLEHFSTFRERVGEKEVNDYLTAAYNRLLTTYLLNKVSIEDAAGMIATIRQQLAAHAIDDAVVQYKLAIAGALLDQRYEEAVALFGEQINLLSLIDFEIIMGIFNRLDRQDKALMEKVAAISLENVTDPGFKTAMTNYINHIISN
jgi:thiol-disulfide isomerase/thioredoxin